MKLTISKKLICLMISSVCLFTALAGIGAVKASGSTPMGWYCVRAQNHEQPRLDPPMAYIESYDGYYIDHRHTDPLAEDKVVYLTFDAGYENGNVAKILDTLKAEAVPGAFFILGNLPESEPRLVRRMAEEGHLVCNHTFTHKDMTGSHAPQLEQELCRLETACRDLCGVEVAKFFRPPEGKFDRAMLTEAQRLGYKTIFWSFAYADWDNSNQPHPEAAIQKILGNAHNGAVILLHPTSATNAAILGQVISELKSQGYRFGTLYELTEGVDFYESTEK